MSCSFSLSPYMQLLYLHILPIYNLYLFPHMVCCDIKVYFIARGYIPNIFAFENPYPLNPEESDLFYFLLICTKRPKSPIFQRAVLSSSELHAIQCIPRVATTLAFLLIIRQKANTRDMRKSLQIVPSVLDFALTL